MGGGKCILELGNENSKKKIQSIYLTILTTQKQYLGYFY